MILNILYAFLAVGILGSLFGVGLAVASKFLEVKKDPKIIEIEEALPGSNCGACGYAGCSAYAEAIITEEDVDLTLCKPGGPETLEKIGEIMGVKVDASAEKMVAQVYCRGTKTTCTYRFNYDGVEDCNALYSLFGGDKVCPYGCLGLGSCIKVCPVDAISYTDEGWLNVDRDKCISCEKCIDVCPTGVMKMTPYSADYIVACNSTDKGAAVRKYCTVGCIGCKLCIKKSPDGGYLVEDFLASIDYKAEGDRSEAVEACPPKCIVKLLEPKREMEKVPETRKGDENN